MKTDANVVGKGCLEETLQKLALKPQKIVDLIPSCASLSDLREQLVTAAYPA